MQSIVVKKYHFVDLYNWMATANKFLDYILY